MKRADHNVSRKNISHAALRVLYGLKDAGYIAYIAGGGVRDLLLDRHPKDFDVATDATPKELRRLFRNCRIIGRRFRLAHVRFRGELIETSTFRAPAPEEEDDISNNIFSTNDTGFVVRDNIFGTPEQDACRRDFTINALFYNIADFSVIDYTGGLKDLKDKVIRVIGDPDVRFREDPVRMIRAARFAGLLNFSIEEDAFNSICQHRHLLEHAAPSRMYEEVKKLFFCGQAKPVYDWLAKTDLIHQLFPKFAIWLDNDPKRMHWVNETLVQMDRWRKAQLKIHPALLFALIFGEYHEQMALKLQQEGISPTDSKRSAVYNHLLDLCQRVRIPKQIIHQIADIMSNQLRFEKMYASKSKRFVNSQGFLDAFLYYKFAAKTLNRHQEELEFWAKQRKQSMSHR